MLGEEARIGEEASQAGRCRSSSHDRSQSAPSEEEGSLKDELPADRFCDVTRDGDVVDVLRFRPHSVFGHPAARRVVFAIEFKARGRAAPRPWCIAMYTIDALDRRWSRVLSEVSRG